MNMTLNRKMSSLAEKAIFLALRQYDLRLDYSLSNLESLERIIAKESERFSSRMKFENNEKEIDVSSRIWGVYLGELLRLKHGGDWQVRNEKVVINISGTTFSPIQYVKNKLLGETTLSVPEYFRKTYRSVSRKEKKGKRKHFIPRYIEVLGIKIPSWILIAIGVFALVFMCGTIERGLRIVGLRPTLVPKATASPTDTFTPNEEISSIIHGRLQQVYSVSRDDGVIEVYWKIEDNINKKLTRSGARLDVMHVAESLCEAGYCTGLRMVGTFLMVDKYGNEDEFTVINVYFSSSTLQRTNWKNIVPSNIFYIADEAEVHPDFLE